MMQTCPLKLHAVILIEPATFRSQIYTTETMHGTKEMINHLRTRPARRLFGPTNG